MLSLDPVAADCAHPLAGHISQAARDKAIIRMNRQENFEEERRAKGIFWIKPLIELKKCKFLEI
jgi:hypothetical protein